MTYKQRTTSGTVGLYKHYLGRERDYSKYLILLNIHSSHPQTLSVCPSIFFTTAHLMNFKFCRCNATKEEAQCLDNFVSF